MHHILDEQKSAAKSVIFKLPWSNYFETHWLIDK